MSIYFRFTGLAIAVLAAAAGMAPAARAAGQLSAMDYIEIEQLVHRLNLALDYCGNGGRDFAGLFTADGEYVIDDGGKLRAFRGAAQLAGLAGGPDCAATRTAPRRYLSHLAENLIIEPSAGGAHGTSYAIYPGRKGKYFQADAAGQVGLYHDDYVRTAKGWRVKLRRHEVSPEGAGE
ncbi:MAG: nuclear transport factor 2 family protein [Steroidobacteraceae bacterium]